MAAYQKDDGTTMVFADHYVAHLSSRDRILSRTVLIKYWPALPRIGIGYISGVFRDPDYSQNHYIHVFWDDTYAQFDDLKGEVVKGPLSIPESWPVLANAGFQKIRAAFLDQNNTVVFFSGGRYAMVALKSLEKGLEADFIESGLFATRWPFLSDFKFIDFILPEPETGRLLFASDTNYISVKAEDFNCHSNHPFCPGLCTLHSRVSPGNSQRAAPPHLGGKGLFMEGSLDKVPVSVTHGSVPSHWPALVEARFY